MEEEIRRIERTTKYKYEQIPGCCHARGFSVVGAPIPTTKPYTDTQLKGFTAGYEATKGY